MFEEGFGDRAAGLREAFSNRNALQCGYCTPGMLASALEYIESGGTADRAYKGDASKFEALGPWSCGFKDR